MNSDAPSWGEINSDSIKGLEKKLEARLDRIEKRAGLQYGPGGRCGSCRHWEELKHYISKLGRCKALSILEESSYWTEELKLKLQSDKEHELAFISQDPAAKAAGSLIRYKGGLITKPSFGCVNYTPK
jgi:hypothetical protein